MGTEIERKYLLKNDDWRMFASVGTHMRQGYLSGNGLISIRVRVAGNEATLNIKGATLGVCRTEFEYPIPVQDGEELLDRYCPRPLIEKTRYFVEHAGRLWEIDVFEGDNEGLTVAEIELESPEEHFSLPEWIGEEVSHDPRYYNVCLQQHPFKEWVKGG